MDLSADCQRKWIVSLLSVPAFAPSSCLCLSPPSLTLLSAALSLLLSFNALSLSPSLTLSLLDFSFEPLCLHPSLISPCLSHLPLVFLSLPHFPPSFLAWTHPAVLTALFQLRWNHLFCPLLKLNWLKAPAVQRAPLSLTSMGILQPSTIKYIHEKFPLLYTHICSVYTVYIEILYMCKNPDRKDTTLMWYCIFSRPANIGHECHSISVLERLR